MGGCFSFYIAILLEKITVFLISRPINSMSKDMASYKICNSFAGLDLFSYLVEMQE